MPAPEPAAPRPRVLFVSNIAWDFVWQRHQTLAAFFADEHDVAFLELPGLRRVGWRDAGRIVSRAWSLVRPQQSRASAPRPVQLLLPWVLPATNALSRAWNRRRLRAVLAPWRAGVDTIVCYSPTPSALAALDAVPHRRLVYDCTDDWSAVRGVPDSVRRAEAELLRRAHLTVVPSRALAEKHRAAARRLERLPHGALLERFRPVAQHVPPPQPVTLLYYGHLHRQHLDFDALAGVARLRPAWRIVLVGPVKTPGEFPANVELVGQQPHEQLAGWIARAHLLLLPYVLNDYTASVLPAKTYECLATGRPVVASPLRELTADFGAVMRFALGAEAIVRECEAALATDDSAARAKRLALAEANAWSSRYATLQEWLHELPALP